MDTKNASRYLPTYREREIRFICNHALRGESLCLVGIAGSGKSNLINFLRDDKEAKRPYLEDNTENTHFPDVDATGWDGNAESLWDAMADSLMSVAKPTTPKDVATPADALHRLEQTLSWVCHRDGHRVMFLLDEFDAVLRQGPPTVFEQFGRLHAARDNRERLSYLVFTRKLPHVLGRTHDLETQSKFYDLLRPNIYALPLHNENDSMKMLTHLYSVANPPFEEDDLEQIWKMSGGHSRLIKITFDICARKGPATNWSEESLAQEAEVHDECRRILNGLHRQEREVIIRYANGQSQASDPLTVDHLRRRGMIIPDGRIFSPLMAAFLTDHLVHEG